MLHRLLPLLAFAACVGTSSTPTELRDGPPPAPCEVPPVVDLPAELDVCIDAALTCLEVQTAQECVAAYEDCSYAIPEAHEPACQLSLVWGMLEDTASVSPEWSEYMEAVFKTCGESVALGLSVEIEAAGYTPLCCVRHPLTLACECYPFNKSCRHCQKVGT